MLDHTLSLRFTTLQGRSCIHYLVLSPNCAKIKFVTNSCQKFQSIKSSRALLEKKYKKIAHKLKSSKRSQDVKVAKRAQDPNCQEIQIAKMSKLPKVLDVKNPMAPPRDPKVHGIHAIHVTKRSRCPRVSSRSPHCQKPSFFS